MALTSASFMGLGGYSTVLLTKLDKIDCSQVLAAVLKADKELLGHIRMGPPVHNVEHNWIEDELVGNTFYATCTVSASIQCSAWFSTSASLERVVTSDCIVMRDGGEWYAQVTGTTAGSVILATTYGSTTHVATSLWGLGGVSVSAKFMVVASPYSDIDDASDDRSQSRGKRRNFTQVFERAVQITQTRQGIDMEAVTSELQTQIKYRTLEIKRELDVSVINGIAKGDGARRTGLTEWRTMMGIINYIRDYDMDCVVNDTLVTQVSGALTVGNLNTAIYGIWDAGGLDEMSDPIIVVGANQQRVIAAWEKDLRRVEQGERQVGYYRDIFLSDMGKEFPVVMDRWVPSDKLVVLDRARVVLKALQGDAWHMEKMAKTGRNEKWQISGQYTIELRNADKCHALMYDLS